MADVTIAILGMKRLGTSVGLALKRYNRQEAEHTFTVVGYDTNSDFVKAAQKFGALDKAENRPEQAVRGADIVVMAVPYGDVKTAYELIGPDVRPGAVIVDMSTLKANPLSWSEKELSKEVHVVSATPIVNPQYIFDGTDETKRATEDYFDNGTMLLMPSVTSVKEAINLASDFSRIIGATPHFMDAAEHDALVSATEALPSLLGLAYFNALSQGNGWLDLQRLTNPAMGMMTHHLFDTHPDDLRDTWLDSKAVILRYMDELIASMRELRTAVADGDRDALESILEVNSREYEGWINRRHNNQWEEADAPETPSFGGVVGNMFGGFVSNRFGGGNNKKDK